MIFRRSRACRTLSGRSTMSCLHLEEGTRHAMAEQTVHVSEFTNELLLILRSQKTARAWGGAHKR